VDSNRQIKILETAKWFGKRKFLILHFVSPQYGVKELRSNNKSVLSVCGVVSSPRWFLFRRFKPHAIVSCHVMSIYLRQTEDTTVVFKIFVCLFEAA
jgi:hypothetical protein